MDMDNATTTSGSAMFQFVPPGRTMVSIPDNPSHPVLIDWEEVEKQARERGSNWYIARALLAVRDKTWKSIPPPEALRPANTTRGTSK